MTSSKGRAPVVSLGRVFDGTAWEKIESGADVAPFAGHIVAYETNISYYGDPGDQWRRPGGNRHNPLNYLHRDRHSLPSRADGVRGARKSLPFGTGRGRVQTMTNDNKSIDDRLRDADYCLARFDAVLEDLVREGVDLLSIEIALGDLVIRTACKDPVTASGTLESIARILKGAARAAA
jgi:hypothetical protein